MLKFATVAAVAVAAPLAAWQAAPQSAPGAPDLSRVTAGTYRTDPAHTLVGWTVDHLGFNKYFGTIGDATGTLVIDPDKPEAARVDITIPMDKLVTASAGLTKHMLSADFFDIAKHPTARFVSRRIKVDGTDADIEGDLTLLGVTRPVVLSAEFVGAGKAPARAGGRDTVGFEAEAVIRRSDFGMNYSIPMVSDEVALDISVAFEKQ